MAIFSSRTLQRMLYETAMLIPKAKHREYVRDINKTADGLSKEWELAIAWGFTRIASVTYEPKGAGTRRLTRASIKVSKRARSAGVGRRSR